MGAFDSGVEAYIEAEATVKVFFPVDKRGTADISCRQCRFFRNNYNTCGLNGEVVAYPTKYVGFHCPLIPSIQQNDNINHKENDTDESNQ